ncbi:unnamed protein product [Polarella glacialis]|uniref:Uncharacterized protein n=1 Tax=Polarella glacialis TaxID=89957 RepID=A0A813LVB1_POLGL|nr:unnamed protein product [Polarella glacialis]
MSARRSFPLRRGSFAVIGSFATKVLLDGAACSSLALLRRGAATWRPRPNLAMGRWTAKGGPQQSSSVAVEAVGPPRRPGTVSAERTADEVAKEAEVLLQTCSLSDEQQRAWETVSAAVADATPPPEETKKGPPPPEVLAAMQSARKAQDAFVAGLPPAQKEEVLQLLELKKRGRKLRSKEEVIILKVEHLADAQVSRQAESESAAVKEKKKEVMARAFWLYQQDRQKQEVTNYVESTEWKRIRAIGGDNPMLRGYLERAGWDASWPLPEPEGRLLRREGQEAALARYAPRKAK